MSHTLLLTGSRMIMAPSRASISLRHSSVRPIEMWEIPGFLSRMTFLPSSSRISPLPGTPLNDLRDSSTDSLGTPMLWQTSRARSMAPRYSVAMYDPSRTISVSPS